MNMPFYVKLYLATVPIFFIIDMVWLGYLGRDLYKKHLGFILSDSVNWAAAISFYLMYIVGILVFAVVPALQKASLLQAVGWGALFGFFTYATYDLTNLATIKGWPLPIVLVDILWGVVLCSTVAMLSYLLGRWLQ